MITTLIGSRYLTAVANSPISIVKPPSPTNATDCRSGIGDLRRDGVGQARRHRRQVAGAGEQLPRFIWICRAAQVVIVPESVEMIASSASRSLSVPATTCGFSGMSSRCARVSHQLAPLLHARLRRLEERAIGAAPELRDQGLQRRPRVAAQADVDREAQADPRRVAVDLHAAALLVLRVDTPCTGSWCRPSAACRTPPSPPRTARCRAGRCRRW